MKQKVMPLVQHLEELRRVLIKSIIVLSITSVAGWWFRSDLLGLLARPITDRGYKLVYITPLEPLYAQLKLAIMAGFVIALPFVLWQIWGYILPALKPEERKNLRFVVVISLFLFLLGTTFAYFSVFKVGINFFIDIAQGSAVPTLSMGSYLSFVVSFLLPFGLVFELPLIMVFLAKTGVVEPKFFAKKRKYAVLVIFIAAAFLTPGPDIMSQLFMGVPLYLLYEVSIVLASVFSRKKNKIKEENPE